MADRDLSDDLDAVLANEYTAVVTPHVVPAMQAKPARALAEVPAVSVDDAATVPVKQIADRFLGKMLAGLETQFDRGELDATDVMNLLPKVHRVKIDEEKIELARNDGRENLPTLHFTIHLDGGIHAEYVQPPHAEVVDVAEAGEEAQAEQMPTVALTGLDSSGLFAIDMRPIDGAFES